jgi:hypothetical protein
LDPGGHVVREAAPEQGADLIRFPRSSFYQAQAAFGQEAGLVPRKPGPKQAHKLSGELLRFIRETRQQDPAVRHGELVRLIQQRFGITVHPRRIERRLTAPSKKALERIQRPTCGSAGSGRTLRAIATGCHRGSGHASKGWDWRCFCAAA